MNTVYLVPFLYPLFTSIYRYYTLGQWNVNLIGDVIPNHRQKISWHVILSTKWIICCLIQSFSSRKYPKIHKWFGRLTFVTFPIMILSCFVMLFVNPHLVSGCDDTYKQYWLSCCYLVWLINGLSYNYIFGISKIMSSRKLVKQHIFHMKRLLELSWHPLILRTLASFLYYGCNINANLSISISFIPAIVLANFLIRAF